MPRARRTDPGSSHAAAAHVSRDGVARHQCARVLAALKLYKNRTSNELAAESGLDRYIVARRLPELRRRKLVACSGQKTRRDRFTGRPAKTWWPA